MIKKLRHRFIRIAMLAVVLVLVAIISIINLLNYRQVAGDADAILAILSENNGAFPGGPGHGGGPQPDGAVSSVLPDGAMDRPEDPEGFEDLDDLDDWEGLDDWAEELAFRKQSGGFGLGPHHPLSEETPFESRYFSVTLDADGQVSSYDISRIAAVTETDLDACAKAAYMSSRSSGFYEQYRFLKKKATDSTTVLFLDCGRSLSNARNFLLLSILVSLLGVAGVFFLVYFLSGKILRPVQESYEKQKRFITDAGHELKTPLTIIDADVSVAEMEQGQNEWLDDVKTQTRRLTDLTHDLIYLSRMDEDSAPLQLIDFPLSDLATDTVQSFRARAQLEEKTLQTEIAPLVSCHGDEKSLEKLLTILLDNALKYSKEQGGISLSLQQKKHAVELVVQNEVDALDPAMLSHLFDRFYRADASRNSGQGGYGIGLSIAQAIVQAHKGSISASSPDGRSLRITVLLPQRG